MTTHQEKEAALELRLQNTVPDLRKTLKLLIDFDDRTLARCEDVAELETLAYTVLCQARVVATWAREEGVLAIDQAYRQITNHARSEDIEAAMQTDYALGIIDFVADAFQSLLDPDSVGIDPEIEVRRRLVEFHEATTREDPS